MNHTIAENEETSKPRVGPEGAELIEWMDARIGTVLRDIDGTEFARTVLDPAVDPRLLRAFMKEIYLEIHSYQPHAIEGAITAIARMPRSMPVRMIKAMLRHQAEEFDHGEMALRDYCKLGGDEEYARREHRVSPASYAVGAIWRAIAVLPDPFVYLGALYPFEGLTPIVSDRIKALMIARGYPAGAMEFVVFHSEEDPKHTELVRQLIRETVTRFPEAERSIKEGLERFLAVYPIPVWETAFRRARISLGHAADVRGRG